MHQKKFNENQIIIAGFVLIILVIIFTLFRGKIFSESNDSRNSIMPTSKESNLPKYETLSATELNKKITLQKEPVVLLDVRPFDLYIAEHILDAINISLDEFPVGSRIDSHSAIIVIGSDNEDENINEAVEELKKEKFENIRVLAGGMESWKQLVGATVTYGDPKSFVDQSKVSYLDATELNDAIRKDVPVYVIDVRNAGEFAQGHIVGAINIPMNDLEKRRSEIKEKRIVVVGINELQEFQASVQIYDMLLASPFVMRGAMPKWEELNFDLVK
ncbi:MAG: hypothetical protein ACD_8C00098G0004 [uncultured bacterium]|nr:MAG: hypothetical protein ACD_8C00098G0004 [uncultured bacterium]